MFDVKGAGVSGGRIFARCTAGLFTASGSMSMGASGGSAADGIHCLDPDGTLIGKIKVPEVVSNLRLRRPQRNVLYICGTTSLYAVRLMVNGLATY